MENKDLLLEENKSQRGTRLTVRTRLYHGIDHHVDNSSLYDPQKLHKIRVIMMFVTSINWASGLFRDGPVKFGSYFRYYTIWNESFVFFYFLAVVYFFPVTKRQSEALVSFQHQVVISQTIVVLVFWTILWPKLGLGSNSTQVYSNIYKHSVPFLFIVHEFISTYGLYTKRGIWLCMAVLLVYTALNFSLALIWNIVVYPTRFTDPHNALSYPLGVFNFLIVYLVGILLIRLKKNIVVKHFQKVEPLLAEKILRGESITGIVGSLGNTPGYQ